MFATDRPVLLSALSSPAGVCAAVASALTLGFMLPTSFGIPVESEQLKRETFGISPRCDFRCK